MVLLLKKLVINKLKFTATVALLKSQVALRRSLKKCTVLSFCLGH